MEPDQINLLSVGIDVGSSTTHLVFSNLLLVRDETSPTRRFRINKRDIIHESRIIDTPLLDGETIDFSGLIDFAEQECRQAGISLSDIQTGAVIVTGETAKKHNAPQIAEALSHDAGKFVAATAGPNFESLLAAIGSGATARSRQCHNTILSCDIGGGTANMAISKNGEILSTSCIAIGGRLISLDSGGKITRLAKPAAAVMDHLGLAYRLGDPISGSHMSQITATLAGALIEVMTGPAATSLAKALMMTEDLDFSVPIDAVAFSGGVAEFFYGGNGYYGDMGQLLAQELRARIHELPAPVIEPAHKIRATVIGAGAYSLSISGSSCFADDRLSLPMRNIPVMRIDAEQPLLSVGHVASRVEAAFRRFDLTEGEQVVALFFKDPVRVNYPELELFAKGIETALSRSISREIPVILIFERDIACSVGNVIRRETRLKTNLLTLDELNLKEGDWIDIGVPLMDSQVFPVTVKSLVFPE